MVATNVGQAWDEFWLAFDELDAGVRRSRAVNVNSNALRSQARELVQRYFRDVRPHLEALGTSKDHLSLLDSHLQDLLRLANGRNARTSYQRILRAMRQARPRIEVERETLLGRNRAPENGRRTQWTEVENSIYRTLSDLVPSAALSYEQAINDLADADRVSFRGTAVELREALREVLDHLAPDADVMASEGFELEPGRTKPTMKQKVRFILRSRGLTKTASASPESAATRVEAATSSLARSIYERGSLSTHVATTRAEVTQLKMYVDSVLAELLQIHEGAV